LHVKKEKKKEKKRKRKRFWPQAENGMRPRKTIPRNGVRCIASLEILLIYLTPNCACTNLNEKKKDSLTIKYTVPPDAIDASWWWSISLSGLCCLLILFNNDDESLGRPSFLFLLNNLLLIYPNPFSNNPYNFRN
jgi:hypothetical protein